MRWKLSRTVLRGGIGGNADLLLGTVEDGKKQPWYITRHTDEPIFMAGITNWKEYKHQTVEIGFVIVTQDSIGGMVDVHDRRPVVLEPADAWRWMNPETSVEEAAHIAQTKSLPTEAFMWWKVDRTVNVADLNNNGKQLLTPVGIQDGVSSRNGHFCTLDVCHIVASHSALDLPAAQGPVGAHPTDFKYEML
ncbi:SOS response-associated peptidase family protein [Nitrosovibrio sp. Nv6]|uniref:SOS response-associated peptidase family protein n=1 Tax=Nitrosovibrio sp. Nv6 TaxID=1855340 RepID=UPI0008BBE1C4|nr:SOS response-associated peptidase family protein [Nitrosovibrio sp. Nv6]SEP43804.1 SOS response associated peptidase (SRAP) [Nitrosovibrio sp. Nv6]